MGESATKSDGSARHAARRRWIIVAAVLASSTCAVGVHAYWLSHRLPKRFAVVAPERLYRSGEVTAGQLARVQREYGIGRVLCLLDDDADETRRERAAAEALGLRWENVPLTGDGASTPADRQRIVALLTEPNAPPTLVHCAAGVNRTGLAVGLWRLHVDGWPLERVMAELRANGFEDLPKHESLRQALAEEAAAVRKR